MNNPVKTPFGDVAIDELIRVYTLYKESNKRSIQRRKLKNQTEEGKLMNNKKAKEYYEKNREKVLEKARQRRLQKESQAISTEA